MPAIESLYDDCIDALERLDYATALDCADKIREWSLTLDARNYDRADIEGLRAFANLVNFNHGHRVPV